MHVWKEKRVQYSRYNRITIINLDLGVYYDGSI